MSTPARPPSLHDYQPPLQTGGPARPRTVTIAATVLIAQAILGLVGIAVSFTFRDNLLEEKINASAIGKHLAGVPTDISLFGVGCSVLLSVIFLVLAAFVLRGSNPARITAWVFSGLGLLLGGRILFNSPSPAKEGPGWYEANSAVAIVLLLALTIHVAIIVLLAMRPCNVYFARRRA
jgi:hypothetical protein